MRIPSTLTATPEEIDAYLAKVNYELVVPLRKPVTLGETYTELRLREPTAAEWAQWASLKGIEGDIKAVAVVSGLPEPAARLIGSRDLSRAASFIALFLG